MPRTQSRFAFAQAVAWTVFLSAVGSTLSSGALAASPIVRVSGHGERKVAPDLAQIQIEIQSRDASPQVAQNRSAEVHAELEKRIMKEYRIEKKDIQTVQIGVQPEYDYSGRGKPGAPKILGYLATHSLMIRYRNLEKAGQLIDAAISCGKPQAPVLISGVTFSLEQPEKHEAETLALAMKQARSRADAIAQAAGRKVEAIRSVTQGGAEPHPFMMAAPMSNEAFRAKGASTPTQLSPGEISLSADVTVEYEF